MGVSVFPAAGGGVTMKVAEFTSSGTFTAPSNCTAVEVFAVGGGGGGGGVISSGSDTTATAGGGGGGGGVIKRIVPVTAGSSYTVTIGSGGAGSVASGTSSLSTAANGGSTTFGSLITAYGGTGGATWDTVNVGSVSVNTPTFGPGGGGAANGAAAGGIGQASGGGGGGASIEIIRPTYTASVAGSINYPLTNASTPAVNAWVVPVANNKSLQGLYGKIGINSGSSSSISYTLMNSMGGYGVEGYGGGGGGGVQVNLNSTDLGTNAPFAGLGCDGGGSGGVTLNSTSAQSIAGSAATANTGGGGGGGVAKGADSTVRAANGGAGAAGYVKVIYWS